MNKGRAIMKRITAMAVVLLAAACNPNTTNLGRQGLGNNGGGTANPGTGGGSGGGTLQPPQQLLACGDLKTISARQFSAIAVTATDLYGVSNGGDLVRVPLNGGSEEVLETTRTGHVLDGRLAVTSEGIYFSL